MFGKVRQTWLALFGDEPNERSRKTYGGDRTIHRTTWLDVETDGAGNVVSVWFRCLPLPFRQTRVDDRRALQMRVVKPKLRIQSIEYQSQEDR